LHEPNPNSQSTTTSTHLQVLHEPNPNLQSTTTSTHLQVLHVLGQRPQRENCDTKHVTGYDCAYNGDEIGSDEAKGGDLCSVEQDNTLKHADQSSEDVLLRVQHLQGLGV
jgi:hypothetical protein